MPIRFFDMFAGIGGFRSGLEAVGGFECVGYCEIDKYARRAYEILYNTEGEVFFDDARKINPNELPDFELLVAGFPCQSFSVSGKRLGFADARGTLFFEIARIAAAKKPKYLLLENVPGLLSHDRGRTFEVILKTLDRMGYDVAWQVLNSADFKVPQSRKRVFIVGYNREKCAGEILAFDQANPQTLVQRCGASQGNRVYSADGLACAVTSSAGGFGGKTGIYSVENSDFWLPIISNTKSGYQVAFPGDSINIAFLSENSRRGRVGHDMSHTLTTTATQAYYFIDMNPDPKVTELARCITARYDAGIGNHKSERSALLIDGITTAQILDLKDSEKDTYLIIFQDKQGNVHIGMLRKLTPKECLRLQGFDDEQIDKLLDAGFSDSRLYKMAGNAVCVNVVSAVGRKILEVEKHNNERQGDENA